jgi:4Fe-4S ferredoxin
MIDAPWREAWEEAVERIIRKERVAEPSKFFLEEVEFELAEEEVMISPVDEETLKKIEEKISKVETILEKPRYRRAIERGSIDVFLRGVKSALGKDKGSEEQKA